MKKSNGFTMLELIIVLAIMSIILTLVLGIYTQNNKIISEVNIKSTLQTESQNISQKISNSGMESSGIIKLILSDNTVIKLGEDDEQKYGNLTLVDKDGKVDTINPKNNQWISVKEITINNKYEKETIDGTKEILDTSFNIKYDKNVESIEGSSIPKGDISITQETFDDTKKSTGFSSSVISKNVESILIRPSNLFSGMNASGDLIEEENRKISDATSIEFNINLAKKKGMSDVKYSIPITITFRNKVIT